MAVEFVEVEVFVLMDESGDYRTGHDDDSVCEAFDDAIGGSGARRMIKVVLRVPKPVPTVLRGEVPAESTSEIELAIETP